MQASKWDPLLGRYTLRVRRTRKRGVTQEKDAKQHCCFGYHFKMSCNQTPWLLDGLCSLGKGALVQTGYMVEPHLGVRSPQAGERRGLTSQLPVPSHCPLVKVMPQEGTQKRLRLLDAVFAQGAGSVAPAWCAVWDESGLRSGPRETGSGCAL